MTIDRRQMMQGGLAGLSLLGSGFASGALNRAFAQSPDSSSTIALEPGRPFTDREINVFSPVIRSRVSALCETIIPRTDTPGAVDAGVPKFIELLYAHWMNAEERAVFDQGLSDLDGFENLPVKTQQKQLEELENNSDHPWFELGGVSFLQSGDDVPPFIVMLKEFTVTGFFTSEIGAVDILELNPMGEFDGDIPRNASASSWAAKPLM